MPNYFYTAKSFDEQTETGTLSAADERQLAQIIKGRGMFLVKADISGTAGRGFKFGFSSFFQRVSLTDKMMFIKNMEVMFSAGLSMVKSLDILAGQSRSRKLKSVLLDIKKKVNEGENLSDALSVYPKIFSELFVNMIKVGEETGTLDEIFKVLALHLAKEYDLKSKIKSAMIYPAIIMTVMIVVGAVMVTVVLPSLSVFFTTLSVDIPIYTKVLLFTGNFLSEKWYLLIVVPLLFIAAVFFSIRIKRGKMIADALLLKLPIVSMVVKKSNSALLIRSLSSLISSGVSLVKSLEISSKTIGNHYFREAILGAEEKIKKGEKLSGALKPHQDIFPFGVIEMIEVGEETGKTSIVLKKLAEFYEQEAVDAIQKITVLIEPTLIIALGLAVGLFAFSIIQPMYSSLQLINQ